MYEISMGKLKSGRNIYWAYSLPYHQDLKKFYTLKNAKGYIQKKINASSKSGGWFGDSKGHRIAALKGKRRIGKKAGKWFRGNVFTMSSSELTKKMKYGKGVKKPTALRTKKIKGKTYSQYYYKPHYPGEFWD